MCPVCFFCCSVGSFRRFCFLLKLLQPVFFSMLMIYLHQDNTRIYGYGFLEAFFMPRSGLTEQNTTVVKIKAIQESLVRNCNSPFFSFGFVKSRYNYFFRNAGCTLQER